MTARSQDLPSPEGTARLARAAAALTAATFGLLVVGASVRANGAGLACPDWPLCFGEVVPPIDVKVGFEFGHRVLAGLISLGFLGVGAALFRSPSPPGSAVAVARRIWGFAAVALAVQIVLGGLTVLKLLAEWTVASHLLTGNTFCASLLVLTLALRGRAAPAVPGWARPIAAALALLVPAQLFLGGWVAGANAGLVCGAWPGCYTADGAWFPTFAGVVGLQVAHRAVAYTLLAAAGIGALALRRSPLGRPAASVFAAVSLQAAIGVTNVLLRLPVEVTLLHTAGAATVFLTTTWLQWSTWTAPVAASAAAPRAAGVPA